MNHAELERIARGVNQNVDGFLIPVLIMRLDGRTPVADWIPFTRCFTPGSQIAVHLLKAQHNARQQRLRNSH